MITAPPMTTPTRTLERPTTAIPDHTDAHTDCAVAVRSGAVAARIPVSSRADTRKVAASIQKTTRIDSAVPASTPAAAVPSSMKITRLDSDTEFADSRSSRSTIAGSSALLAGRKKVPTVAWANAIVYSSHIWSALPTSRNPSTMAPRTTSETIITRLRSHRST